VKKMELLERKGGTEEGHRSQSSLNTRLLHVPRGPATTVQLNSIFGFKGGGKSQGKMSGLLQGERICDPRKNENPCEFRGVQERQANGGKKCKKGNIFMRFEGAGDGRNPEKEGWGPRRWASRGGKIKA